MFHKAMLIPALLLALGVFAACGDDDDSATPTPSVCDDADALRESVESLTELDVVATGTDGLKAAIDEVLADVEALAGSASDLLAPDVDTLQQAVEDGRDTLSDIPDDATLVDRLTAVTAALTDISSAWTGLQETLSGEC